MEDNGNIKKSNELLGHKRKDDKEIIEENNKVEISNSKGELKNTHIKEEGKISQSTNNNIFSIKLLGQDKNESMTKMLIKTFGAFKISKITFKSRSSPI